MHSYLLFWHAFKLTRELILVHILQEPRNSALVIHEQKTVLDKVNISDRDGVNKRPIKDARDSRSKGRHSEEERAVT